MHADQNSELNRLHDVARFDRVSTSQVGDRARHSQDSHVGEGLPSSEPAKNRTRDEVEDDREDEDPAEPDA